MSITATVINDTVQLPVHVPDGTRVEIVLPGEEKPPGEKVPTLYEALKPLIGCINTGIGDLAENHDHDL